MTTEEKFNAAVNVIRSLPKNGSYQPSNELMLRFYSYFKQATQGPCSGSRPAFWDLVGRAKYDAWKRLGDMSRKDAMAKYVDELHSIVETMSYSDKVANFLEAPTNELDGINFDDLEMVAGDVLERVRSLPNSPLASREGSPIRFISSMSSSRSVSPSNAEDEEENEESDHSDQEYLDTTEVPNIPAEASAGDREPEKNIPAEASAGDREPEKNIPNGTVGTDKAVQHVSRTRRRSVHNVDISQEVAKVVESLRADLQQLTNRIDSLESTRKRQPLERRTGLFGGLQPKLVVFLIVWPFVASLIVNRWMLRRK